MEEDGFDLNDKRICDLLMHENVSDCTAQFKRGNSYILLSRLWKLSARSLMSSEKTCNWFCGAYFK